MEQSSKHSINYSKLGNNELFNIHYSHVNDKITHHIDANVIVISATTQLTQEIIKIAMQHSFIVLEQLTRFHCLIKKRLYVRKILYQIINNKPHANDIMSHLK